MSYVLQSRTFYCFVNDKKAICKTQDIESATKFPSSEKAFKELHRASKKLKDFQVVDLKTNKVVKEITKTKRRQFTNSERIAVYNKNKGRCAICGEYVPFDIFTVDHILPLAKGGDNDLSNLQCTCRTCNLVKQDILPEELMEKLTQIVLYQMRRKYDYSFWQKLKRLKTEKRKRKN